MIEEKTLSAIRAAEKKAIELKELAANESQKLIDAAQKKAMEIAATREKETGKKNEAALKKFYMELEKRKYEAISAGSIESEKQRKAGEKKLPRAVDFLFQEFRKEIER